MNSPVKKWLLRSKTSRPSGRIFSYEQREYHSQISSKNGSFDVLHFSDWVNILAFDESHNIICIKQFRVGVDDITIEIPGGAIEKNESPLDAAKRELREESGYESDTWKSLGYMNPNPGFMTNRCYAFLALNAKKVTTQDLDDLEEIEVITLSEDSFREHVKNQMISHALVQATYVLYLCSEFKS